MKTTSGQRLGAGGRPGAPSSLTARMSVLGSVATSRARRHVEGPIKAHESAAIATAMEEIENLTKGTNSGALSKKEFEAWYKASLFWEQQKKSAEKAEGKMKKADKEAARDIN